MVTPLKTLMGFSVYLNVQLKFYNLPYIFIKPDKEPNNYGHKKERDRKVCLPVSFIILLLSDVSTGRGSVAVRPVIPGLYHNISAFHHRGPVFRRWPKQRGWRSSTLPCF